MPGSSTSSGSSTSTPTLMDNQYSQWGMQLSQLLSALGNNQYAWAMDQFNRGQAVTDQNISHYMDLAGKGAGLAQNLLSRYTDVFEPMMDNYIRQAGTYNSEGRQRFMAGQAESTVGQATTAARNEAERKLQGFGINPNSGRYQDLVQTSRIQDAAARAGAGTQAALNVADRGRAMTANIAQMGQNVPGMTVNALQSAYTGVTGAQNATLGMLNTGANLTSSAAPFYNAASGAIKMPPVGNNTTSQQRSNSTQQDPSGSSQGARGQGNGPGAQGAGGQGAGGSGRGGPGGAYGGGDSQTAAGKGQGGDPRFGGSGVRNMPAGGSAAGVPGIMNDVDKKMARLNGEREQLFGPEDQPYNAIQDYGDNGTGDPEDDNRDLGLDPWDPASFAGAQGSPWWAQDQQLTTDLVGKQGEWPEPPATVPEGETIEDLPGFSTQFNNWDQPDQQYNWDQFNQPQPQQEFQQPEPYQEDPFNQQQPQQEFGGGWEEPYQQSGGYQNYGGNWEQFEQPQQQEQYAGSSGSGGYEPPQEQSGSYAGQYSGYAKGGPVRSRGVLPTTGGHVPRSASPSQGRVTDDIPARLNADEYVIPRDVVKDHGTKFFRDLIKKSRQNRLGMTGDASREPKPKMKPGLRLNPTFVSRGM